MQAAIRETAQSQRYRGEADELIVATVVGPPVDPKRKADDFVETAIYLSYCSCFIIWSEREDLNPPTPSLPDLSNPVGARPPPPGIPGDAI